MKKILLGLTALLAVSCSTVKQIEVNTTDEHGAHVQITSGVRLFGGCSLRMCQYTMPGHKSIYGIALDIENQIVHASQGDMLNIYLKDSSVISLQNLYDTQSEVEEHVETRLQTNTYTDFVPVYDAWYGAFYSVPVYRTMHYTEPVVYQESWVRLYYYISDADLSKLMNARVDHISIATDSFTISRSGRKTPKAVKELMELFGK